MFVIIDIADKKQIQRPEGASSIQPSPSTGAQEPSNALGLGCK